MQTSWHPKPGDKIFRPKRLRRYRLRRVLSIPALFSAGYGNVGGSIYYALGVVALIALGATPIALAVAGIIFIFNSLTYAEGSTMIPEAGGSASFARHGFNDLGGFISGWALMLSYIVVIAISAYTIPPYLSYFFPILKQPAVGTSLAMGVILLLMLLNILGIRESSKLNIFFILFGVATLLTLVVLGFLLIVAPNPQALWQHIFGAGNWPTTSKLIYGIAIAALCFTGVETIAQLAEETRHPERNIPQAYILLVVAVLILFTSISVIALGAMTPQLLADPVGGWARDPVAGIVAHLPSQALRAIFAPLVAIVASIIMFSSTNVGVLGSSRLAFNLAKQRQFPVTLSRVHPHFRTPYIATISFSLVAVLLLTPGFFATHFLADLGALYVFGALLCFALAHASILSLRVKKPDLPRPFKLGGNIKVKRRELPLTALFGLIATTFIWIIIVATQPYSRWAGFTWMIGGFIIYYLYRRRAHLPLTHTPTAKEPFFEL